MRWIVASVYVALWVVEELKKREGVEMSKKEQIIDKIDKLTEALCQNKKEQTREEMQRNIRRASNEKILRRQIEMLTEYSRTCGVDRSPEASRAIVSLYRSLLEAKCLLFVGIGITFFGLSHLIKRIPVKGIQLIKR